MVMVDRTEKASVTEEMIADNQKTCTDCKTRKTPLWRVGPAGPKTLCNACGIKYRKRKVPSVKGQERRDMGHRSHTDGADAADAVPSSVSFSTIPASAASKAAIHGDNNFSVPLNIKLKALGEQFLLQRPPSIVKRQKFQKRRKLGEEEQAAFCLMALSCGYIFA